MFFKFVADLEPLKIKRRVGDAFKFVFIHLQRKVNICQLSKCHILNFNYAIVIFIFMAKLPKSECLFGLKINDSGNPKQAQVKPVYGDKNFDV